MTIPTTTVTTDNLVTAGVVPIFAEAGDSDYNGSIDARDLTMLKQYLLNQNYARTLGGGPDPYDVNGDGAIDKNDVKALIRLLTGEETPDAGWISKGPSVRSACLPQLVRFQDDSRTAYDSMLRETLAYRWDFFEHHFILHQLKDYQRFVAMGEGNNVRPYYKEQFKGRLNGSFSLSNRLTWWLPTGTAGVLIRTYWRFIRAWRHRS